MKNIYQEPWPCGVTEISKNEFERNKNRLGEIKEVRVEGATGKSDTIVKVIGTKAVLWLDGFAVGYMGEGPHGLIWLLEQVGVVFTEDQVFNKPTIDILTFFKIQNILEPHNIKL